MAKHADLNLGQVVRHKVFKYRGVVFDVDPVFMLTEEWYEKSAQTRPPKNEPWYHVLVHDSQQETYVAQRNLEPDVSGLSVNHPDVAVYFTDFRDGRYVLAQSKN